MKQELIKMLKELAEDFEYYAECVEDGDALWGYFILAEHKVREAHELHDEWAESEGLE
jgi:uncharacterized Zn finger protein